MFRALINNGLVNAPRDDSTFRNSEYLLSTFGISQRLQLHNGCVNTIAWDENGEYILSGSDDRKIAVIQVFDSFGHLPGEVLFSRKLAAQSNIFVARFLRNKNNEQIIVGFKCGCVLHVNTNDTPENYSMVCCHECAVYDILTPADQPESFVTISHDRTVRIFDTRESTTSPLSSAERCSHQCSYVDQARQSGRKTLAACVYKMNFKFPVTAGDVHPLDGCRSMAFGFADGFVRLFDIRRLTSSGAPSPTGDTACPLAYRIARPVDMPARVDDSHHTRCDYGPAYITSVKFESVSSPVDPRWCRLQFPPLRTTRPVATGAKCLLVSHMYAPVYLFDITTDEVVKCTDIPPADWLPSTRSENVESSNGASAGQSEPEQQRNHVARDLQRTNLEYRRALALIYWFGTRNSRQRTNQTDRRGLTAEDTASDRSTSSSGSGQTQAGAAVDENEADRRTGRDVDGDEEEGEQREEVGNVERSVNESPSFTSPLSLLTDTYVSNVLSSAPRCRQLMSFQGRVSCRTVIKAAVFWGRNHILSGSECGHVIAWDRWTGAPVCVVKADNSVVNRIEPHPRLPLFACSGIDNTIKIVEPTPSALISDEDNEETVDWNSLSGKCKDRAKKLCTENAAYMRETLSSGSTALERLIQLNIARAIRSIRSRISESSRTSVSGGQDEA